jgi:hypothetical protein
MKTKTPHQRIIKLAKLIFYYVYEMAFSIYYIMPIRISPSIRNTKYFLDESFMMTWMLNLASSLIYEISCAYHTQIRVNAAWVFDSCTNGQLKSFLCHSIKTNLRKVCSSPFLSSWFLVMIERENRSLFWSLNRSIVIFQNRGNWFRRLPGSIPDYCWVIFMPESMDQIIFSSIFSSTTICE